MLYFILLVIMALVYLFVMSKEIRRSLDIFALAALVVLVLAVAISQAVMNRGLVLEILIVVCGFFLMIKAWREIGQMNQRGRRSNRNKRR